MRFPVIGALIAVALLVSATTVSAASSHRVKVTPNNMKGWVFMQEDPTGFGAMEHGPGTPPLGRGSAKLVVDGTGREILVKAAYQGARFADITALRYSTHRASGSSAVAISLQFNIDANLNDTNEAYQGRLVYEPYYSHVVLSGTWQTWNTQDNAAPGNWWFTRGPQNTPGTGCAQSAPCTWSQLLARFPNAGIHRTFGAVLLKAGGPWAGGFSGNVDALTIGIRGHNAVYDFEPARIDADKDDGRDDD